MGAFRSAPAAMRAGRSGFARNLVPKATASKLPAAMPSLASSTCQKIHNCPTRRVTMKMRLGTDRLPSLRVSKRIMSVGKH